MKKFILLLTVLFSLTAYAQKYDSTKRSQWQNINAAGYFYKVIGVQEGGVLILRAGAPDLLAQADSGGVRYHHGNLEVWDGTQWKVSTGAGGVGTDSAGTIVADNYFLKFTSLDVNPDDGKDTALLTFADTLNFHATSAFFDSVSNFHIKGYGEDDNAHYEIKFQPNFHQVSIENDFGQTNITMYNGSNSNYQRPSTELSSSDTDSSTTLSVQKGGVKIFGSIGPSSHGYFQIENVDTLGSQPEFIAAFDPDGYVKKYLFPVSTATMQQTYDVAPAAFPTIDLGTNAFNLSGVGNSVSVAFGVENSNVETSQYLQTGSTINIAGSKAGIGRSATIEVNGAAAQGYIQATGGGDSLSRIDVQLRRLLLIGKQQFFYQNNVVDSFARFSFNTQDTSATFIIKSPDTNIVKIKGHLASSIKSTDSLVVIDTDGKLKVLAKTSLTSGISALTGDVTASGSGSVAATLATVNSNVGTFGSATQVPGITVNAKGLITAVSNTTITPAVGSITGLGTGVATAAAINIGTAGSVIINGGAGGTPSSITLTNATGLPLTTGVTGALGVTNGGNGLTSATLGGIRYASAANTISELAGNTTTTLNVLTQTGNGSVSAAPVWTATTGTGNVARINATTFSGLTGVSNLTVSSGGAIQNVANGNNGFITFNTTGIVWERNINDANPAAIIKQTHASSTGNIVNFASSISATALIIDRTGKITYDATVTTAGTTGNQTINKPSGTVNIAAAGSSVTVTNSTITANSIVYAVLRTNDATATGIKSVVPSAGSCVITLNAAATAEVSVGFIVHN